MAASAVAVAGYAASGNYKKAASAAIGLVPGGKVLSSVARVASKASRAVKSSRTVARVASAVRKVTRRSGCNSFDAGTSVLMADGTRKPIEQVVVGDQVAAADLETGQADGKDVTDLIRHLESEVWVTLTIATPAGVDEIDATAEHPFWVLDHAGDPTVGVWTDAVDLRAGDLLVTADGDTATVLATTTDTL
ncbi:Hint domain-containing protein, partial [Demequina subtropica]|uniref:Hint domain-containing protein n=1 Tax=Demequina subtropica TaxID=1638989 RepID=UPI001E626470